MENLIFCAVHTVKYKNAHLGFLIQAKLKNLMASSKKAKTPICC